MVDAAVAHMHTTKQVEEKNKKLLAIKGNKTIRTFHRELGHIMWEKVGMARTEQSLKEALEEIPKLREDFWKNVNVPGTGEELNKNLEMAGRVADLLELGELMAEDALNRAESCGGHFRLESQTEEGEAKRDDENFKFVSAWEFTGTPSEAKLHKEDLEFENIELKTRSYK
mgnify:CR=1 FL=1